MAKYAHLTVEELKDLLRKEKKPVSGPKRTLIARLAAVNRSKKRKASAAKKKARGMKTYTKAAIKKKAKKATTSKRSKGAKLRASGVEYGSKIPGATYYVYHKGGSHKYWAIQAKGSKVCTHYGRIGYGGKLGCKKFKTAALAREYVAEKRAEKRRKGYKRGSVRQIFDWGYPLTRKNPCTYRWRHKKNP